MSKKKLIAGIFLIFLSISLMFSIFIFGNFIDNKSGKIELNRVSNSNILKNQSRDIILLYFGYVGCSTVCSPSLFIIDSIYREYIKEFSEKSIKVLFVNLLLDIDREQPDIFVKSFNENFEGLYIGKSDLNKLAKEFNVYFSNSFRDRYELSHTSYIYILKKEKKGYIIKYLYANYPPSKGDILDGLREVNSLLKK